jgi:hypothetical protein
LKSALLLPTLNRLFFNASDFFYYSLFAYKENICLGPDLPLINARRGAFLGKNIAKLTSKDFAHRSFGQLFFELNHFGLLITCHVGFAIFTHRHLSEG